MEKNREIETNTVITEDFIPQHKQCIDHPERKSNKEIVDSKNDI
jgi:hypothetical protein